MNWSDAEVRAALGLSGSGEGVYPSVSTDTRAIQSGSLFVALRGERFDAHDFLDQAVAKGARAAVVERVLDTMPSGLTYYVVPDTLRALGALARHRRRALSARVCAITGSNGKTTTKELVKSALSPRFRVHATTGNLNNLIGAPLTILAAPENAEVLIVELGTNSPGEIAQLGAIVEPDAVLVTGISEEHLEGLGDLEGVMREETALLADIPEDGVIVVADEPPMLPEHARNVSRNTRVGGYSDRADADLRAENVRLDEQGQVHFTWRGLPVTLSLRGRHNARNAMLALGLADAWGVPAEAAVAGLASIQQPKMRSEIHKYGAMTVIADCYNANPASMEAAIDLLVAMPRAGGRVAVVGSMLELGPTSDALHSAAADRIAGSEVDLIVAIGKFVAAFEPHAPRLGGRLINAEDALAAEKPLTERLTGNEVVLLKGSRGVALERLLPALEQQGTRSQSGNAPARKTGE